MMPSPINRKMTVLGFATLWRGDVNPTSYCHDGIQDGGSLVLPDSNSLFRFSIAATVAALM